MEKREKQTPEMRKNNIISKMKNRYFSPVLDPQIQSFNLLMYTGITAEIVVTFIAVLINNAASIIVNFILFLLFFLMIAVADKKKCYRLCSWIIVTVVFMIAFPVLFFFCGGYKSGMPCFFMLAVTFTSILLDKRGRTTALTIEFILYICCFLIAYYKPETVYPFASEFDRVFDVIVSFVLSGVLIMLVLLLRSRIFYVRQEQIQELNRELTARNETLAQYDRMKSDFLATIAHEVNTPLAVISASSSDTLDLLQEVPLNMEEITENQKIIERRVKLIDNILLDLMDTVAIENGRLPLNREPVSLSEFLKNVCDSHFKQANANGNRIIYDLEPELPHIWADSSRIEQVMTNLLSNSFRHTKEGIITIKLARTGDSQIVSVTDNGEGMDAEMARIVLKQYVSTKADYWRHGIGLYICRRIVMAHGGDIWIDSEKGQGTTISFTLKEGADYE